MFSEWITRSRPLPIALTVTTTTFLFGKRRPPTQEKLDVVDKVVQAICDVPERWGYLEVELPFKYCERIVSAARGKMAPTLCTQLFVRPVDDYPGDEDASKDQRALPLPNVPDLWIWEARLTVEGSPNAIRSLNLSPVPVDVCLQIMAQCPNLEKARLGFTDADMEYQGDPVVAPKLISADFRFDLDIDNDARSFPLFQNLAAPSLTTLRVTKVNQYPLALSIGDFISRSKSIKRFLFCTEENGKLGMITDIYKCTPSLEAVALGFPTELEEFKAFLVQLGSRRYLPHLTSLIIQPWHWFQEPFMRELRDFAERRSKKYGGKLEQIEVVLDLCDVMNLVADRDIGKEINEMGVAFSFKETGVDTLTCDWD